VGEAIEQFVEIAEEYARRTGGPHFDIPLWVMAATGGMFYITATPPRDPHTLPEEEKDLLGLAAQHPHFTSEQIRGWLEHLANDRRMDEEFLIIGLVRFIEYRLDDIFENQARGVERARKVPDAIADASLDPLATAEMLEEVIQTRAPGRPEYTADQLPSIIEMFDQLAAAPSLEKLRQNRVALETWRELSVPLLSELSHLDTTPPWL
jgi:hypothetical protein